MQTTKRICFISTRIAGNDGVSLEIEKWAGVLEHMGHNCCYIAGECDRDDSVSELIAECHFNHPTIMEITKGLFGREIRTPELTRKIHELIWVIKQNLRAALKKLQPDIIILENCVTIPMNIPLGVALVEHVMETGIPCIAHHHDFYWERERYTVNAADDYLHVAFPPPLPQIQHIAINSQAAEEFSRRTGLPCRVIPNVMDFDNPPAEVDDYAENFRRDIGLQEDDILILQPTRVVQRKGIEHAIELLSRLQDPRCKLVIAHASGDEGDEYAERIRSYAELLHAEVIFADRFIGNRRATTDDGHRIYTIDDAYHCADFVTYPSTYEGFGNALLEAVYYKLPVLCNRYAIYQTDIEPLCLDIIVMNGFLTNEVVEQVRRALTNKEWRQAMVEYNYETAARFFSYQRVEDELLAIFSKPRLTITPCKELY